MRGIELSEDYFRRFGEPMLERVFPELRGRIAAGLAGHGSECYGFDDALSRDHDFSSGFAIWLTQEDYDSFGFRLERAYAKLLKENPPSAEKSGSSACGEAETGVCVIGDFFQRHIGFPREPQTWQEWLYTPEYAFAEATNGKVFRDDPGVFSGIRKAILEAMPDDVLRKKIAARAVQMAQSGQYNFPRCLKHGEPAAARLALDEFVRNAISMIFLLNHRFVPYYKWCFRAMRQLPQLSELGDTLEYLLLSRDPDSDKLEMVEYFCVKIGEELRSRGFSDSKETYLEPHAFSVMRGIRNREIASLHVMEG